MPRWYQQGLARAATLVACATDHLARWATPATPWLFIALLRAWVPSMVAVAAAVMFFLVPQSREVLHGLSEPVLGSLDDFDRERQLSSINVLAWMAYVASAMVLGVSVWYSARLLVTVGAHRGTPNALEEPPGHTGLCRAATWYPRWLGAGVLAASVAALIFANYTPQLGEAWARVLAVVSVAGPWGLAVGVWLHANAPQTSSGRRWMLTGALSSVAAAVGLVMAQPDKWPVWAWSIGCSTMPAVLWWWLSERRSRLPFRHDETRRNPAASQAFGNVILTTVLLALGGGLALLLMANLPPQPIRAFGSAATILLFLAAACAFSSAGQLWLRYVASDVPGLTTAVLLGAGILVALVGQEGLGEESLPAPPAGALALAPAPAPSASAAAGLAPTVYLNAFGGGLRAAAFTALVLAQADDASCGEFGRRLAAASGVSGGSLGIATYLVARQELTAVGDPWAPCAEGAEGLPLTYVVAYALVQDHLSPVIGRMLAVDAPKLHSLAGQPPTRGQALLDSWNEALVAGLGEALNPQQAGKFAALAMPLAQLHGGLQPAPAVYFNATDADSGHVVWFSNVQNGQVGTQIGPSKQRFAAQVSVGQAVLHSARFPFVTPAGAYREAAWAQGKLVPRLVDGGYADNSGATTLAGLRPTGRPWLVNVDGNPAPVAGCEKEAQRRPPIITAVRGLLQARTAHADHALASLQGAADGEVTASNGRAVNIVFDLARVYGVPVPGAPEQTAPACQQIARAQQPPLGWYMSYEAAVLLVHSARVGAMDLCQKLNLHCRSMLPLPPLPQ